MEANLCVLDAGQRLVQSKRVSDPGGHDIGADALADPARGNGGGIRIAAQDTHLYAYLGPADEEADEAGVLGEEEAAVSQDTDLTAGRLEQVSPSRPWDGPAVRVDGLDLVVESTRLLGGLRPEFGFLGLEEICDGPAVAG
ncbi:hypothetical protein ABT120_19930 [Nonomuraea angiospora]|uniref:hypothetical protein n=1 Tax=Nonomuraea angiospora TaxID=46172 RepID=UPI003327B5C6